MENIHQFREQFLFLFAQNVKRRGTLIGIVQVFNLLLCKSNHHTRVVALVGRQIQLQNAINVIPSTALFEENAQVADLHGLLATSAECLISITVDYT